MDIMSPWAEASGRQRMVAKGEKRDNTLKGCLCLCSMHAQKRKTDVSFFPVSLALSSYLYP